MHQPFLLRLIYNFKLPKVNSVTENLQLSTHAFLEKFNRLKPWAQTEIIFTCRSGKRAGEAREMAIQLGFKK